MGSKPSVIAEMCQESLLLMGWGVEGGILLHFKDNRERKVKRDRKGIWERGEAKE